jgi:hypothetical protein
MSLFWLTTLRLPEIEKAFVQVAIDVKEILVLDGIDQLSNPPGFRIRFHDLYGVLPEILVQNTGDRVSTIDRIQNEAAKLTAIIHIRQDIAGMFPGCEFLLPMQIDQRYVVGIRFGGKTVLAEKKSHWEAYHELLKVAVGNLF